MSVRRDDIVTFLDTELESARFRDYGPNGLQVVGAEEVTRIAVAVSASLEVFERCRAVRAELLIVHHGLFWDGASPVIGPLERRRLTSLFEGDISLVAYHLPLDAHHEHGNNALLLRLLGLGPAAPFGDARGAPIGFADVFGEPLALAAIRSTLRDALGREPLVFDGGRDTVTSVAAVSGAGARLLREAAGRGVDLLITGEAEEDSPYLAAELGIALICAGHHATETLGVRAVGELVTDRFGLPHEFIAVANPV